MKSMSPERSPRVSTLTLACGVPRHDVVERQRGPDFRRLTAHARDDDRAQTIADWTSRCPGAVIATPRACTLYSTWPTQTLIVQRLPEQIRSLPRLIPKRYLLLPLSRGRLRSYTHDCHFFPTRVASGDIVNVVCRSRYSSDGFFRSLPRSRCKRIGGGHAKAIHRSSIEASHCDRTTRQGGRGDRGVTPSSRDAPPPSIHLTDRQILTPSRGERSRSPKCVRMEFLECKLTTTVI